MNFQVTSDILLLEIIHKFIVCIFEALCTHRGIRGKLFILYVTPMLEYHIFFDTNFPILSYQFYFRSSWWCYAWKVLDGTSYLHL